MTPTWARGRVPIITTLIHSRLIDYITSSAEARRASYAEIVHQTGIAASEETIARALDKAGYHRSLAVQKPFLSLAAMQKRLD